MPRPRNISERRWMSTKLGLAELISRASLLSGKVVPTCRGGAACTSGGRQQVAGPCCEHRRSALWLQTERFEMLKGQHRLRAGRRAACREPVPRITGYYQVSLCEVTTNDARAIGASGCGLHGLVDVSTRLGGFARSAGTELRLAKLCRSLGSVISHLDSPCKHSRTLWPRRQPLGGWRAL